MHTRPESSVKIPSECQTIWCHSLLRLTQRFTFILKKRAEINVFNECLKLTINKTRRRTRTQVIAGVCSAFGRTPKQMLKLKIFYGSVLPNNPSSLCCLGSQLLVAWYERISSTTANLQVKWYIKYFLCRLQSAEGRSWQSLERIIPPPMEPA